MTVRKWGVRVTFECLIFSKIMGLEFGLWAGKMFRDFQSYV